MDARIDLVQKVCRLLVSSVAVLTLAACSSGGKSSATPTDEANSAGETGDVAYGNVTVGLTDGPVDGASSVVVQFSGAEFVRDDGTAMRFDYDPPVNINLLDQQGGERALLLNGNQIAVGSYSSVRLLVNAKADGIYDSYIVINDAQFELRVPSGSEAKLKINSPFTVVEGQGADFTIDFDLRKSVHQPGGQTGPSGDPVYQLHPSLRLVKTADTGSIAGALDPGIFAGLDCSQPQSGYALYVFPGASVTPDDIDGLDVEPVKTAKVKFKDSAYTYKVAYLEPGDYTVAATCQADKDQSDVDDLNQTVQTVTFVGATTVTVSVGTDITLNF